VNQERLTAKKLLIRPRPFMYGVRGQAGRCRVQGESDRPLTAADFHRLTTATIWKLLRPSPAQGHLWQQSLRALTALQEAVHMDIAANDPVLVVNVQRPTTASGRARHFGVPMYGGPPVPGVRHIESGRAR